MPFTLIATVSVDDTGGFGTRTLTVPAGVTTAHLGVMMMASSAGGSTAGSAPGWTARVDGVTTGNSTWTILTRLGGQTAGDVITISTVATSPQMNVTALWFDTDGQDVATVGAPTVRNGAFGATATAASVTTTAASQPVLVLTQDRTGGATVISSWTGGTPTDDVYHKDPAYAQNSLYCGHFTQATAGATAARVATYSLSSGNAGGVQIAIAAPPLARDIDYTITGPAGNALIVTGPAGNTLTLNGPST